MRRREVEYRVRVNEDPGCLWAEVVELEGCFASGENMDELLENLLEAIGLYLSGPKRTVHVKMKSWEVLGQPNTASGEEELRLLVTA
ncbi:MAG: HicB like antitoxin of bacterial toxin-antitoxin system [Acidimicrobiaceae bacterium]|nr:HicB like antitoxin of bacterial toxin-antitoxin system [Acidimicrobiaceae bacterium]